MNIITHVRLSRMISRVVRENFAVPIKPVSFAFGCIKPDLLLSFRNIPHCQSHAMELLINELEQLMSSLDEGIEPHQLSLRLGVVCHYLTDFFCFVHSENFKGGKIYHLLYEIRQIFFAKRRIFANTFFGKNKISVATNEFIESMCKLYNQMPSSINMDVYYSFLVCVSVIGLLVKGRAMMPASAA